MSEEELRRELNWSCDLDYISRTLLYRHIFYKLALNNWLYDPTKENQFQTVCLDGITNPDLEQYLITKIRAFANTWDIL